MAYTEEELLDWIRKLADGDEPPTQVEMDENPESPCSYTYHTKFGSWTNALEMLGYEPKTGGPEGYRKYTREEILQSIRGLAEGDKAPTVKEFREAEGPSMGPLRREFDSWNEAVFEAGFYPNRNVDKEHLKDELLRLQEEHGYPSMEVVREYGNYSAAPYREKFGSWKKALGSVNIDYKANEKRTKEECLEEIHKFAEGDTPPTLTVIKKKSDFSRSCFIDKFGSWTNAVKEAGYEPIGHPREGYSKEQVVKEVERVIDSWGEPVTKNKFDELSDIAPDTVLRNFGTGWAGVLEELGYEAPKNSRRSVSGGELIEAVRGLADRKGRPPTSTEMDEEGKYCTGSYWRRFDGWKAVIEEAGYDYEEVPKGNNGATYEELEREMHQLKEQLGRIPTTREMNEYGGFHKETYSRRFGCWSNAIEVFFGDAELEDYEEYSRRSSLDHSYRSQKWRSVREDVKERDDNKCQICGVTHSELREKSWRGLTVHHITPVEEFDDVERSHHPDNLISLCQSCHSKVEAGNLKCPDFQRSIEWWA